MAAASEGASGQPQVRAPKGVGKGHGQALRQVAYSWAVAIVLLG